MAEDDQCVKITIIFSKDEDEEPIEDVDSPPKDFEGDAAKVVAKIQGVRLDHQPEETGKTAALYRGKEVRPDITGTYYGQRFVMDTKLYEKSYIKSCDVDKIERDRKATGSDHAIMVNSGHKISEENKSRMNQMGRYIEVPYTQAGWEKSLKAQFLSAFRK